VAKLAKCFREGRQRIEHKPRIGRPVTSLTEQNIKRVSHFIAKNPYATFDEIVEQTSISRGSVFRIIHEALVMRKITSCYVPHQLTSEMRQKRVQFCLENLKKYDGGPGRLCDIITCDEVQINLRSVGRKRSNCSWIGIGESPRILVRPSNFDAKILFCIFFRSSGYVLSHAVEKGKKIDNKYYTQNCLGPAFEALKKQRPASGTQRIALLHDNARPHVHANVHNFLMEHDITLVKHPPYSPDLAPCDFWLFDYIKRNLEDQTSRDSLIRAVTKILEKIPRKEYKKTFEKWIERMKLCVKNDGHYFEHLIK